MHLKFAYYCVDYSEWAVHIGITAFIYFYTYGAHI